MRRWKTKEARREDMMTFGRILSQVGIGFLAFSINKNEMKGKEHA
jgi:hypothetical protein